MNANIIFQWAKKVAALCCTAVATLSLNAQNVGISPATPPTSPFPHPSAGLDVSFNNKGVLIPRVALNSLTDVTTIPSPLTSLLVYNNGTGGLSTPGYYYWNGTSWTKLLSGGSPADAWLVGGNNQGGAAGTAYIFGNMGNHHIDFYTNGVVRGRMSNLGEFFIGTTNTPIPGDLMNGVGNSTFPWAVNGYTSYDAGAVYGLRQAGATGAWGSIQGETTAGIAANSAGVAGLAASTNHRGVIGQKPAGGVGWGGLFLNDLGYSGGFFNVSDRNFKKDIKPIIGALDKILKLKGSVYRYAEPYSEFLGGDDIYFGFVAQDVEKVIPEIVKEKSISPSYTRSFNTNSIEIQGKVVSTISLIPFLVEAIKEQQTQIEHLKSEIEKLKSQK
jgi:hypothetical protein